MPNEPILTQGEARERLLRSCGNALDSDATAVLKSHAALIERLKAERHEIEKTPPMSNEEREAIRARIDSIEYLHTRTDIHTVRETLEAAGYKSESRDGKEWWSNGGAWSTADGAYGMLQYEHLLEAIKRFRALDAALTRVEAERDALSDKLKGDTHEPIKH